MEGLPIVPLESQKPLSSVPTERLREKLRNYSIQNREKRRETAADSLRFGLGEIQAQVQALDDLTEKDVTGLAQRIKRRKHADEEDMYRLSHAFLQGIENIRAFAKIPGAMQILVKELTGADTSRRVSASECLCNLSLGEQPVCDKIASMAGTYLVTYLDSVDESLRRISLWTLTNLIATQGKGAQMLAQMKLVPKLWHLYVAGEASPIGITSVDVDCREDAAICLMLLGIQASRLISKEDKEFIAMNMHLKNPTSPGGEFLLHIIFHVGIIDSTSPLTEQQLIYLINCCLNNLSQCNDFQSTPNRYRILYAVCVLANLLASQSEASNVLLRQMASVWQMNLINMLNKLFAYREPALTQEVLWLLNNLLQAQATAGTPLGGPFLDKLNIPRREELFQLSTTTSEKKEDEESMAMN